MYQRALAGVPDFDSLVMRGSIDVSSSAPPYACQSFRQKICYTIEILIARAAQFPRTYPTT